MTEPERGVWMTWEEAGVDVSLAADGSLVFRAALVPARTELQIDPAGRRARFLPIDTPPGFEYADPLVPRRSRWWRFRRR